MYRHRVATLLHRLGIRRHPEKGHWEPSQVIDHLGLQVDSLRGLFLVTPPRVEKIRAQAAALLAQATSRARVVPTRSVASFTGLCQSVYLAVAPARFFLRALHSAIGSDGVLGDGTPLLFRHKWNSSVRLPHQALEDLKWWALFPRKYNGRPLSLIHISEPTRPY